MTMLQATPQRNSRLSIAGRTNFPLLRPSEIIQALAGLNIEITKNELNEPQRHREKLRNIFLQLLNLCTGKTEEDFIVSAKVIDTNDIYVDENSSQLHGDPQQYVELKLFLALRELFESCGYREFSWRDMYGSPTPKRLQHQLSALCNLAGNFLNEQLKVYAELSESRNDLVLALTQVNKDHEELTQQYSQLQFQANASNEEMEQIMLECQQLELEIASNNQLQSSSREESAALKKQTNDLKDELSAAIWALQEAQAEEENLRMQVVSSPDRRQLDVDRTKHELDQQKRHNAKLEAQLQNVKAKIACLERARKDFDSVGLRLEELLEQMNKYKSLVEEMEATMERINANEREINKIQDDTEANEHQHKRMEEKIVFQRKEHKLQLDAAQEALEMVKTQLLLVEKDRREALLRREASELEIRHIEAAMEEQKEKTNQEIERMISEFKEVERAFLERQNELLKLNGIGN